MTNPFRAGSSQNSWLMPVSLMALLVGFLASVSWITMDTRETRLRTLPTDIQARFAAGSLDLQEEYMKVQEEVKRLREDNTRLQNMVAQGTNASVELNASLQESKLFSGLTEVEGPGITIILRDSAQPPDEFIPEANIVHDYDVLRVVNEMWAAGAEAVSVNGRRVGPTSSFRCVGPTILVDSVKIASPVTIRVVGDPDALFGAINLPGGALEDLRRVDPAMVQVEVVKRHLLPAYAGTTKFNWATLPKPPEPQSEQEAEATS